LIGGHSTDLIIGLAEGKAERWSGGSFIDFRTPCPYLARLPGKS